MRNKVRPVTLVSIGLLIALILISMLFFITRDKATVEVPIDLEQAKSNIIPPVEVPTEPEQAKSNIISLIQEGNYTEAQVQTQKLIADFSGNEQVAEAAHEIAQQYQESEELDKAIELSQYALDNWPQTPSAIWLQMRIAVCNIARGNDEMAQEAISKLTSEYSQHPHLPLTLYILAEQYRVSWRYEEAKNLYQLIIQQHPDSEYADKAKFGLSTVTTLSLIDLGSYDLAESSTDKLVAEFSSHPDLPAMLLDIAQRYVWSREYERAKRIFEIIVQKFPASPYAQKARSGLTKMNQITDIIFNLIESGKDEQVQASLEDLADEFAGHPDLPLTFNHFAMMYEELGRFEEAKKIYQQITWRFHNTPLADYAQLDIQRTDILSLLKIGQQSDAQAKFDSLIRDFEHHPHLPTSVILTAEGCYKIAVQFANEGSDAQSKEYIQKAIDITARIPNRFPGSHEIPNAYCFLGQCYDKLHEYEKSIESYRKVVNDYPDYDMAWYALFMVGRNYENLGESGVISKLEADRNTVAAYEQLLERYPDCEMANIAIRWLSKHKSE